MVHLGSLSRGDKEKKKNNENIQEVPIFMGLAERN